VIAAPGASGSTAAPAAHISEYEAHDLIESLSHQHGVLLSPEAAEALATHALDQATLIDTAEKVLARAVETLPREDGWILITSERMRSLLSAVTLAPSAAAAPVAHSSQQASAAPLVESAVERIVKAILDGDREAAFGLLRQLEEEGAHATSVTAGTAALLDRLYQALQKGTPGENLPFFESAARTSTERLHRLATLFADALHSTYALPYTGYKIALAQAFDIA
jgi:DNA polymerase III delta subunit